MVKYVVAFVLSLVVFVPQAQPQPPNFVVERIQALKIAAERETANRSTPHEAQERIEQEQMAHLIADRQAQLRRDTEKLVALTAELKQRVDHASSGVLSMEVIKMATEIQKLAKSVQDKMKNPF